MKKAAVFLIGLVLGAVILVIAINAGGTYSARREFRRIAGLELSRASQSSPRIITASDLKKLPPIARKYMELSGVAGKPMPRSVRLQMKGTMSLGKGKPWVPFTAEQYYTTGQPSMAWFGVVKAAPLVTVSARDSYVSGEGRMLVRLMSVLKIDDARGKDMDMAALMRYLSEMIWFPASLLGGNVHWQALNGQSAMVFITDRGLTVAGVCRFNKGGELVEFVAPRLCSITGKLEEWHAGPGDGSGGAVKYMEVDGVRIPAGGFASFKLADGMYPYIRLELTRVEFDPQGTY